MVVLKNMYLEKNLEEREEEVTGGVTVEEKEGEGNLKERGGNPEEDGK